VDTSGDCQAKFTPSRRVSQSLTHPPVSAVAATVTIAQQVMPAFDPAAHVELLPGTKPKAPRWPWEDDFTDLWTATGHRLRT
jgi:hypothetical protein